MAITEAKDQVRLLIADVGGDSGTDFLFGDEEIETFLTLRQDNVFLAAASAMRAMAVNEAMVAKVITFLDLKTDGAKLADALRAAADDMEKQADEDASGLAIAELVTEPFGARRARGYTL